MIDGAVILNPPNTGERVERVWMFVSRDAEGKENVCGAMLGVMGWQPFITGNPHILELMKAPARKLAKSETGKTIHLLSFGVREEVEGWR
jgi:hypothetical protein